MGLIFSVCGFAPMCFFFRLKNCDRQSFFFHSVMLMHRMKTQTLHVCAKKTQCNSLSIAVYGCVLFQKKKKKGNKITTCQKLLEKRQYCILYTHERVKQCRMILRLHARWNACVELTWKSKFTLNCNDSDCSVQFMAQIAS